jgi:membrane-bound lytic murein transglycosylase B
MRSRCFALCLLTAILSPQLAAAQGDFATWLEAFKDEAAAAGISQATLTSALEGVAPLEEIIELDRRQPEFTQTFWSYIDRRVTPRRVERGRALLAQHRSLLQEMTARYGVQAGYLVAFWGLETNFGDFLGKTPVIASLATLAYDRRRSDFFRNQLLDALRMVDGGHARLADMTGSWAGAMGQLQFMPNTFIRYAVDGDGDGRRDIWRSYPDAFASAGNYLNRIGWRPGERWGREVRLPPEFDLSLADMQIEKPLSEWRALGVRRADGGALPGSTMSGSIVLPGGAAGPAFLVYRNFRNIMVWNRSLLYALAVGYLSDRIIGLGQLRAGRPAGERPLRRVEVEELQALLTARGFDLGEPDGIVGARTRAAVRLYQKGANLPADGYPTIELLEGLRQKSGN